MENLIGIMVLLIKDNGSIINLMEKYSNWFLTFNNFRVYLNGKIKDLTMETENKTKWMVWVNFHGLMEENMKDFIKITKDKVSGFILLEINRFMKVNGKMGNSMVKE